MKLPIVIKGTFGGLCLFTDVKYGVFWDLYIFVTVPVFYLCIYKTSYDREM